MLLLSTAAEVITMTAERSQDGGSDLLTAILGGSVGFLLGAFGRSLGIPSDCRGHDAAVSDRDEALATWIADRDYLLRRECKGLRDSAPTAPPAADPAGVYGQDQERFERAMEKLDRKIADAKSQALHEYRDEARRARLDVANVIANEGWAHRAWRRLARQPVPALQTPDAARPVLEAWRKPSSMSGGRPTWPDDATKRTLDDAIESMPVTGP